MMALRIEPLPEGGLLVSEVPGAFASPNGCFYPLLFACSDLDEALGFIKDKLQPEHEPAAKERVTLSTGVSVPAIGPDIACKNPAC